MPNFSSQIKAQCFTLRMVAKGYRWWATGKVASKAELDALEAKYAELFGCHLSPAKKAYRKRCGLANAHFVSAPLPPEVMDGGFVYFLLATDGSGEIRNHSKLKDAWDPTQRLVWGDYVLHKATRNRIIGGGTHWSFYIVPQVQKELEHYVGWCLKNNPEELKSFFESNLRRPLHHGVRSFLTRLLRRAHQSFCKMHPGKVWPARDPSKPLPFISGFRPNDE